MTRFSRRWLRRWTSFIGRLGVHQNLAGFGQLTPPLFLHDSQLLRSEFGPKVVPPQPLIKALPELFAAKQEPVREGVKKLAARHRTCNLA